MKKHQFTVEITGSVYRVKKGLQSGYDSTLYTLQKLTDGYEMRICGRKYLIDFCPGDNWNADAPESALLSGVLHALRRALDGVPEPLVIEAVAELKAALSQPLQLIEICHTHKEPQLIYEYSLN